MNRRLAAIVEREGDGYVALCPEVDVASQGDTVAEARDNITEALNLFFEAASAGEVDRRMRGEIHVTHVEVAVGHSNMPTGGFAGSEMTPSPEAIPAHLTQLRRFGGRTSGKSRSWRFFRHYSWSAVSLQIVFGDMIFSSTPSNR